MSKCEARSHDQQGGQAVDQGFFQHLSEIGLLQRPQETFGILKTDDPHWHDLFTVLVEENDGRRPKQAEALEQRRILVSSGGVTYLVDRLEKRGLVERRDCPEDRRARRAHLTDEGEALIRRIFPQHADAIRAATAGLDKKEKRQALRLLRTLGRAAAGTDGGGP